QVGWQACFVLTGAVGFVWLALWWTLYRLPHEHPRVNAAELAYIQDGQTAKVVPMTWLEALEHKETWGFAAGKFFSDPVWWFYLYWLPPYLYDVRKFNLNEIGWALPVIYIMADIGSVAGGWISGFLMRRGWATGRARKSGLAINAVCMPIAALAVLAESPILAVALVSLATAAHQGWSANLYTTVSDVFPQNAVATVTGIGGCVGGFGGFLFSGMIAGYIVTHFGYTPLFLTMGCFHLTGLLIIHLTMGEMKPVSRRVALG
ncbi:MAG: MFS transporter, partial [Bryobacteraceae bacterium]|nr:MFS transporter [Bryobacteraceae bacterium]